MAFTSARRRLAAVLAATCAGAAATVAAGAAVTVATGAAVTVAAGAARAVTPDNPPGAARLTGKQRAVLLDATRRFRDVRKALAAGYLPTKECVPGMGFHYAKPGLVEDVNIDPTLPEMLVYTPVADGSVRLSALEFFRADSDGNLKTDTDRPTLFGHPFDGPMAGHPLPPGAPAMPVHYDLHVWLYQTNPAGQLAAENPEVKCTNLRGTGQSRLD